MNKKILPVLSVLMLFVLFFTLRGALTPSRARAAAAGGNKSQMQMKNGMYQTMLGTGTYR